MTVLADRENQFAGPLMSAWACKTMTNKLELMAAILQSDFFAPFQWDVGVTGHRQEACRPLCGGLVQAEDTAQLPWSGPVTCVEKARQSDLGYLQEAGRKWADARARRRTSDLYLRSPWAAAALVVSPRRSGLRSSISLTNGPWQPGSGKKNGAE